MAATQTFVNYQLFHYFVTLQGQPASPKRCLLSSLNLFLDILYIAVRILFLIVYCDIPASINNESNNESAIAGTRRKKH